MPNSLVNIGAKNISCEQTEQEQYIQFTFSTNLTVFPYDYCKLLSLKCGTAGLNLGKFCAGSPCSSASPVLDMCI
jgi:hypothetical protein